MLFFSIIKRSVLMPLFCYYKDMLGKVTTQTTQKFLAFLFFALFLTSPIAMATAHTLTKMRE